MEKFAVIGLGYVGLPLALSLSNKYNVVAFDNDKLRINTLKMVLILIMNLKKVI